MKLSNRELILAFLTMIALVLGGTYYFGGPKYEEWKTFSEAAAELNGRIKVAERQLEQEGAYEAELQEMLGQLPEHPADRDVAGQLLRSLQQLANKANLTLLKRDAGDEDQLGQLYEVTIDCTYEGELNALVRFLYDLQSQGAIFDVQQLTVQPGKGRNQLKGSFKVDCAYRRNNAGPESIQVEPGAS